MWPDPPQFMTKVWRGGGSEGVWVWVRMDIKISCLKIVSNKILEQHWNIFFHYYYYFQDARNNVWTERRDIQCKFRQQFKTQSRVSPQNCTIRTEAFYYVYWMRDYITSDVVPYRHKNGGKGLLYFLIRQGTSPEWERGPAGWHQNIKHMAVTRLGLTAAAPPIKKQNKTENKDSSESVKSSCSLLHFIWKHFLREKWNYKMHLQEWCH